MTITVGFRIASSTNSEQTDWHPLPNASLYLDDAMRVGCVRSGGPYANFGLHPFPHLEVVRRGKAAIGDGRAGLESFFICKGHRGEHASFMQSCAELKEKAGLPTTTKARLALRINFDTIFAPHKRNTRENSVALPPTSQEYAGANSELRVAYAKGRPPASWPISVSLPGGTLNTLAITFANGSVNFLRNKEKTHGGSFTLKKIGGRYQLSCKRVLGIHGRRGKFSSPGLKQKMAPFFVRPSLRSTSLAVSISAEHKCWVDHVKELDAKMCLDVGG